ncbi:MAG: hypothetical protein ACPK85_11125 [Methanosarcina sp.]
MQRTHRHEFNRYVYLNITQTNTEIQCLLWELMGIRVLRYVRVDITG